VDQELCRKQPRMEIELLAREVRVDFQRVSNEETKRDEESKEAQKKCG
jgi:hypothetical protein